MFDIGHYDHLIEPGVDFPSSLAVLRIGQHDVHQLQKEKISLGIQPELGLSM